MYTDDLLILSETEDDLIECLQILINIVTNGK